MERRGRHLRELAHAAAETTILMYASGVERVGELEQASPFESAARAVFAEHERGRLTASDVEALGLRQDEDGGVWIRVGTAWGRG
jgi:hypothetical protein